MLYQKIAPEEKKVQFAGSVRFLPTDLTMYIYNSLKNANAAVINILNLIHKIIKSMRISEKNMEALADTENVTMSSNDTACFKMP